MIYFMLKKAIYSIYFFGAITLSQSSVIDEPYGFVSIESDSINIPIFIDGNLIGHTPIKKPIPLIVGNHYIDIKPLSVSRPFMQGGQTDESKNIYIFRNDTVSIIINPFVFQMRSEKMIKERIYTSYIGAGLGLLMIWQLWIVAS